MNAMKTILSGLLLLAAAGCATVKVSSEGDHSVLDAENNCWYLLCCIPLAGGDCDTPNENLTCFFSPTATLANNMKLVGYAMERKHAKGVRNLKSRFSSENYWFVIERFTCHTSAELVY